MTEPLRVGLIGYGFAGKTFHAPLIAGVAELQLTAVASSNPASVQADWPHVAVEASPQQLLARPDIELVVIATPNSTHAPLAEAALRAEKHVVVDKPVTTTLAEAVALRDLAEESGVLLSVFQNRRWDCDFLTLQHLLASGVLGEVSYIESHFDRYRPQVRDRWREQSGPGSGFWFDLGAHLLDQALYLFGRPDHMVADVIAQRPGSRTDDYFHVQLHYGARRVILHSSALVAALGPRLIVHGTQGSYVKYGLDPQEDALKAGMRPPHPAWGTDPNPGTLTIMRDDVPFVRTFPSLPGNYTAYYAGVAAAIRGQAPNPVPIEQVLLTMELLEQALGSSRPGR